jgi:hypothetical protein
MGVQNVPLKNCFGLFQAASYGSKQSTPECARVAVIRRATSHIKKAMTTTPPASKDKEPARAHMLLFDRYCSAANASMVTAHLTTSHL